MVATRSKTRTSTGAEEKQPKIDDALENATIKRKRRSSKATKADGDAGASKKESKTKKRKTEETSGEKHDDVEVEKQDDGKEVIVLENANGAAAVDGKEQTDVNGEESSTESAQDVEQVAKVDKVEKEETHDMAIDSSRVDLDNQVEPADDEKTAETDVPANEDPGAGGVEPAKEEDTDVVNGQEESTTEKAVGEEKTEDATDEEKLEEKATGATDTQEVKEAEKELVQNDSVTEYGTIHFLYKPKVSTHSSAGNISPFPGHYTGTLLTIRRATHRSKPSIQAPSTMFNDCTSFFNLTSKMIPLESPSSRECFTSVERSCPQLVKVDDSRELHICRCRSLRGLCLISSLIGSGRSFLLSLKMSENCTMH
jgi:hypothetical protein